MTTTAPARRAETRRMRPRTRKAVLVAHILAAGSWLGADVVLGVLVFTTLSTTDPAVAALCRQAMPLLVVPILVAGLAALATGVVLGLGTHHGLVRYKWVAVKLVLTVVLLVLVWMLLRPGLSIAAEELASPVDGLVFPPLVSGSALVFATILSVYRPWGPGAPRVGQAGRVDVELPGLLRPMLATAGSVPAGDGWAFEFKWDGVRAVLAAAGGQVRIASRNGNDITGGYPEIVAAGIGEGRSVLLDGELVALDGAGRPDFGLLQHRMHLRSPAAELRERVPVSFYVFDVLELDGARLLAEPYDARREVLLGLGLGERPGVEVPPSFADVTGAQLMGVARQHGLEGVVAKRRRARYEPGRRSAAWVKSALLSTQEVLVGGWTPGQGRRTATLGALLLGARDREGRLRYLGNVGTGFTEAMLRDLLGRLEPLHRAQSPFDEDVPQQHARGVHWVDPVLVGEVQYRTLTGDGRLRHSAWRGLRPDRDAAEIVVDRG